MQIDNTRQRLERRNGARIGDPRRYTARIGDPRIRLVPIHHPVLAHFAISFRGRLCNVMGRPRGPHGPGPKKFFISFVPYVR